MIAPDLSVLFLVLVAASGAPSVTSSPNITFTGTTSRTPSLITSSPSLNTSSSLQINTSCSSCAFAVDQGNSVLGGLQQVFWFSQTWSVTLDTEHVTVTSFNGSNLTAVTSTRTVLGNVSALDTEVPYVQSLMSTLNNVVEYFNPYPTLVRGTDGSVGTTSYPYGQAFAEVDGINYLYATPNSYCPMNMGGFAVEYGSSCQCVLETWFPAFAPITGIDSSRYAVDQTFYTPLASSVLNQNNVAGMDDIDSLAPWDGQHFKSWLAGNEAFKSAFPNWEDCAFWNKAAGPPGVKLPVAALTATATTTVYHATPVSSATPEPASQSTSPLPKSTSNTHTTPSIVPIASPTPGNQGQSSGDTGGNSGGSDSSGSGSSESQGVTGSSGSSGTSGSPGGDGNTGDVGNTGVGGGSGVNNDGKTGSTGSESTRTPQGGGESGDNTGNTPTSAASVSVGSSVATGSYNSGQSGDSGSNGDSGSSSGGESSISSNGSGSQDGGGQESTGSTGSSDSGSGGESPESNDLPSTASFVVTVGGHTMSGNILGSTAAVVAGTTIIAGSSPSSAGGALVSLHPGASSIYVNGESHPLPTAQASHVSAIPIATIGSHIFSASPGASAIYYAGTTLSQNGAHATIDNTDIYVGASGLVIGGSSAVALPTVDSLQSSVTPIAVVGSQTISAMLGASEVYYAGTTLTQNGAHATIDNTDIYVGAFGLVIGGSSSVALPTLDSSHLSATPIATIGTQTISAISGASEVYYAGTTLVQNGAHGTIDNTDIYIGASGLVIGGSSTLTLPTLDSHQLSATPIATIGSQTISAKPGGSIVYYSGVTLTQNGAHATIDNTDVYVGSSGLVIGSSSTVPIPRLSPTSITASSPEATELQTFTLDGQTLSADSTAIYVGKSTLTLGGPAVTISGTPISLGSSDIVIGSTTYAIPSGALPSGALPGATQTSGVLGSIILGAFGPHTTTASASGTGSAGSSASSAVAFQGAAASLDQWESLAILGSLLLGGLFLLGNRL